MSDSTLGGNADQIAAWLKVLVEPGSTVEMRVLNASGPPHVRHYSSEDLLTTARDALRFSKGAKGVYWLMNPLPAEWSGSPAKDADILRRRWLLIDCDPKRKGTVSSTAEEKEAARATMVVVDAFLDEQGWPAPIIGDSGNGFHLLFRIDLPGEDGGLVHRVLQVLASLFDDEAVSIDMKVANASRICKLYGTLAAKGPNTTDRPHRLSGVITVPEQLDVVPVELLEKLAGGFRDASAAKPVSASGLPIEGSSNELPSRVQTMEAVSIVSAGQATQYCVADKARLYLTKMDASIEGSKGSDRLIKAASVLVNDFALSDGEAFDLLMTEFNPRCQPPWSDAEVHHKVEDAHKNPPHRPAKGAGTANTTGSSSAASPRDETTNLIVESWPAPIDPVAFYGVAGDIVRKIEPHTEADPVAILIQALVAVGNVIGRKAYFRIEATRHYTNLFAVIVGASSVARKGTSGDQVCRVVRQVDEDWFGQRTVGGLVSGEGLIWQVRDPILKKEPVRQGGKKDGKVIEYQEVIADEGIADKRLLVFESEFAAVMKAKSRDSNTLSEIIRQAWDSGRLRTAAKNQPAKATDAHVSLIGHITAAELREVSSQTDMVNGLANRFLWCCVKRSQLLPDGGQVHRVDFDHEIAKLTGAVEFASVEREVRRDDAAAAEWHRLYPSLTAERPGAVGAICNRGAAQVVRLSLLYALLDCSSVVTLEHLHAALALWSYCEASVKYIFGNSLANRTADAILNALKGAGEPGMSRSDISHLFGKNKNKVELDAALQVLFSAKLAHRGTIPTGGRPVETWYAVA